MKKILLLIAAALLVFSLAACGSKPAASDPKKEYTFDEFKAALAQKVTIKDESEKSAELIGAVKGIGFFVGEKAFELYEFSDSAKLKDAGDGTFKFNIEGFGEFEMKSAVNGKFVLLYKEADEAVINAFKAIE